jgi:bacterioferritin
MHATTSPEIINCLQKLYQMEMAGIQRYMHYSFVIMGHNRIPIQGWLRAQATEGMAHATIIGEKITSYGGHPEMQTAPVEESNVHSVDQILNESLKQEEAAVGLYKQLTKLAGDDIALEEMAREFVRTETEHIDEVKKMLRKPA